MSETLAQFIHREPRNVILLLLYRLYGKKGDHAQTQETEINR